MREAVIVSSARTAIGRAKKGSLRDTRPEYFASKMLEGLVERTPGLEKAMVDDVIMGCAMPEGEQGMNVARLIALAAGFPDRGAGHHRQPLLLLGLTDHRPGRRHHPSRQRRHRHRRRRRVDVDGGDGRQQAHRLPRVSWTSMPNAYAAMGTTAEVVAKRYRASPARCRTSSPTTRTRRRRRRSKPASSPTRSSRSMSACARTASWREFVFDTDEGPRADTTVEGLAKLKPVFDPHGNGHRRQRLADQRRRRAPS